MSVDPAPSQAWWRLAARRSVALLLLFYGLLAMFVALVWGPGNSDEIVSGGIGLVPWFGLPLAGLGAAVTSLAEPHRARTAWAGSAAAAA